MNTTTQSIALKERVKSMLCIIRPGMLSVIASLILGGLTLSSHAAVEHIESNVNERISQTLNETFPFYPGWRQTEGYVITRALVPSENGHLIWSEYDSSGRIVRDVHEVVDDYEPTNVSVIPASEYRGYFTELNQLRTASPNAVLMSRTEYAAKTFRPVGAPPAPTAEPGQPAPVDPHALVKPALAQQDIMILVKPDNEIVDESFILARFPVDFRAALELADDAAVPQVVQPPIDAAVQTLMLFRNGTITNPTVNNIGYKAGFLSRDGQLLDPAEFAKPEAGDVIHGGVPNVLVEGWLGTTGGYTDASGRFVFEDEPQRGTPTCAGGTGWLSAKLYSQRFNPRLPDRSPYFLLRPYAPPCMIAYFMLYLPDNQGLNLPSFGFQGASEPFFNTFIVDTLALSGTARIGGLGSSVAVNTGEDATTAYSSLEIAPEPVAFDHYDFDRDGEADRVEWGILQGSDSDPDAEEAGNANTASASPGDFIQLYDQVAIDEVPHRERVIGVWYSSTDDGRPAQPEPPVEGESPVEPVPTNEQDGYTPPDVVRVVDVLSSEDDEALVTAISLEDLRNTDVYVFRESTGELVAERRGLTEDEVRAGDALGANDETGQFFYHLRIRGSQSLFQRFNWHTRGFDQYQVDSGIVDPQFHQREADHLRPGENVRLILINRPTGYIGSVTTQLQSPSQSDSGTEHHLSFPIPEVELLPPNLTIWAERDTKVEQGATKDEENTYRIGNEGAGLSDDSLIRVYSEWLDHDGRPLPDALGDYGYTGRLAKVTKPNTLEPVTGSLTPFSIKPGLHNQVIRLKDTTISREHLYVQVTGEPSNRKQDYSNDG